MNTCHECRLTLDPAREPMRRIGSKDVCEVCYELFEALAGSAYFVNLQESYQEQIKNIRKLFPGANYFE